MLIWKKRPRKSFTIVVFCFVLVKISLFLYSISLFIIFSHYYSSLFIISLFYFYKISALPKMSASGPIVMTSIIRVLMCLYLNFYLFWTSKYVWEFMKKTKHHWMYLKVNRKISFPNNSSYMLWSVNISYSEAFQESLRVTAS